MVIIATGYLRITVYDSFWKKAVRYALVRIYRKESNEIIYEDFFMSDDHGQTADVPLYAPPRMLMMQKDSDACPYACYDVEIRHKGYAAQRITGVQIFAEEYSYIRLFMKPLRQEDKEICSQAILPHTLYKKHDTHVLPYVCDAASDMIKEDIYIEGEEPVALRDYLKNWASGVLYPGWPYESLKAGILILMTQVVSSLKGEEVDGCMMIHADVALPYIRNRNIYMRIAEAVDDVYGRYVMVTEKETRECRWWDLMELAQRGYCAEKILCHCYAGNARINMIDVSSQKDDSCEHTFVSEEEKTFMGNEDIRNIQKQLYLISGHYKEIPRVYADGIFSKKTRQAILMLQRMLGIKENGKADADTRKLIQQLYRELSEKRC